MLVQIVAPGKDDISIILSLEEVKSFCRVVGNHDDKDLSSMTLAAINDAEDITNKQFATATYELYLENFKKEIRLPKNPIQDILEVSYLNVEGSYSILDSTSYYFYEDLERGVIVFEKIPGVKKHKKAVKITFKCGYSKEEDFPPLLRMWLKNRVSTFYEFREEFMSGTTVSNVSHVDDVLNRFKIRTF